MKLTEPEWIETEIKPKHITKQWQFCNYLVFILSSRTNTAMGDGGFCAPKFPLIPYMRNSSEWGVTERRQWRFYLMVYQRWGAQLWPEARGVQSAPSQRAPAHGSWAHGDRGVKER